MHAAGSAGPPLQGVVSGDSFVVTKHALVRRGNVVARRFVGKSGAVQVTACVVFVAGEDGPAVLVDIDRALAVDVPLDRDQVGLDHPDAVLFPAHDGRIDEENGSALYREREWK